MSYDSNNSNQECYHNREIDRRNEPYQLFISKHEVVSKKSVVFIGLASLVVTAATVWSFIYTFNQPKENPSDINNYTLAICFSFTSLVFWVCAIIQYHKYTLTFGSIDRPEEERPLWVAVNSSPTDTNVYSNNKEMAFYAGITVFVALSLITCVYNMIKFYLDQSNPLDPNFPKEDQMPLLVILSIIFCVSLFFLIREFQRFKYYRRFSRLPLETGVFPSEC